MPLQEKLYRTELESNSQLKLKIKSNNKHVESVLCDLREMQVEDVTQVLALQDVVLNSLIDKKLFYPDTRQFYEETILNEDNLVQGIFHGDVLVAFSIMLVPGIDSSDNLGKDIGISGDDLSKVAHLEMVMVDPSFRGNGLQRFFINERLKHAENNNLSPVLTTVDPNNSASLYNLQSCGLEIVRAHVEKYGDKIRHILKRDFRK